MCFICHLTVFFVMYVCCVYVCLMFVSSNTSHSTSVVLTCKTPLNSCLTRQTPLTVVPHPPTICPTPQLMFDSSTPLTVVPHPPTIYPTPQLVFDSSNSFTVLSSRSSSQPSATFTRRRYVCLLTTQLYTCIMTPNIVTNQ